MEEFIDECISSGKVVSGYEYLNLSIVTIIKIEEALYTCNDINARKKILKLLKV